MKILAQITPAAGKTMADLQHLLVDEERAVWAAYRAGALRDMYFQPEPVVVSLVFEAEGHAAVHAILQGFPMVKDRLLDVALVTLGPWLPLEALFDPAHR